MSHSNWDTFPSWENYLTIIIFHSNAESSQSVSRQRGLCHSRHGVGSRGPTTEEADHLFILPGGRNHRMREGEDDGRGRGRSCDWAGKITGSLFPSVPAEKMSGTDGRGERAGKSVLRVNIAVRTLFPPLFHSFGNRSNIDERDDGRRGEGGHSKRPPRRRVIHQAALRRAFCISARFYRTRRRASERERALRAALGQISQ